MIVRVGELYAKGLNKKTLEPLSLLENYELQFITPEVLKLKNGSTIKECAVPINVQLQSNMMRDIEPIAGMFNDLE